jgi:hypothetical protein
MKLCGFEAGLDKPLFLIAGRTERAEQGPRRNDGDATPAPGAGLRGKREVGR